MTGTAGSMRWSVSKTSEPSMPGMRRSSRTASGRAARHCATASLPVEVIHLVLEDAGGETARADRDRLTFEILPFQAHPLGARHRREDARQRQAAFLRRHFAALLRDHGIDHRSRVAAVLVADDHQAQRDTDLRSGETDADLVVHRLDHVADHPADLECDLSDGRGPAPEHWIAILSHL